MERLLATPTTNPILPDNKDIALLILLGHLLAAVLRVADEGKFATLHEQISQVRPLDLDNDFAHQLNVPDFHERRKLPMKATPGARAHPDTAPVYAASWNEAARAA
jgi:hypothetical protein